MDFFNDLLQINEKVENLGKSLWFETLVCKLELEDRLRLNLKGEDEISHYNDWMLKYNLPHLIIV